MINLEWLSGNENAIDLLEENLDKINWSYLSLNKNAMELLLKNPERIDWTELSQNPSAIGLLEMNLDKVDWKWVSINPAIFTYDYSSMYKRCNIYREELMKTRFHPKNFSKFMDWGFIDC